MVMPRPHPLVPDLSTFVMKDLRVVIRNIYTDLSMSENIKIGELVLKRNLSGRKIKRILRRQISVNTTILVLLIS